MRRHSIAGQEYDQTRNNVALGLTVFIAGKPDAEKPSGPPDNAHGSVLDVVQGPGFTPAMLGDYRDRRPVENIVKFWMVS